MITTKPTEANTKTSNEAEKNQYTENKSGTLSRSNFPSGVRQPVNNLLNPADLSHEITMDSLLFKSLIKAPTPSVDGLSVSMNSLANHRLLKIKSNIEFNKWNDFVRLATTKLPAIAERLPASLTMLLPNLGELDFNVSHNFTSGWSLVLKRASNQAKNIIKNDIPYLNESLTETMNETVRIHIDIDDNDVSDWETLTTKGANDVR